MGARIRISAHEGVDQEFSGCIRSWANEALDRTGDLPSPPCVSITIWHTLEEVRTFYQREKGALGVISGEETDFLATHEAWRGYPRIHVCQERLEGVPKTVVQGAIHHEIGHALHHGTQDFYTFRFSRGLLDAGRSHGLDLPLLQVCVYYLSTGIKDLDVVSWLARTGLGFGQWALMGYLMSDCDEERQTWEMVRRAPALKKIALAAYLKTLLPIHAMISGGIQEARPLMNRWRVAYGWLPQQDREGLLRLAQDIMTQGGNTFQQRLDNAAFLLMGESSPVHPVGRGSP